MKGFMDFAMKDDCGSAVEYLGRALDVLRWGCETWKHAAQNDRGAIFCPSFISGTYALYLEAYIGVSYRDADPCSWWLTYVRTTAAVRLATNDRHISPVKRCSRKLKISLRIAIPIRTLVSTSLPRSDCRSQCSQRVPRTRELLECTAHTESRYSLESVIIVRLGGITMPKQRALLLIPRQTRN